MTTYPLYISTEGGGNTITVGCSVDADAVNETATGSTTTSTPSVAAVSSTPTFGVTSSAASFNATNETATAEGEC